MKESELRLLIGEIVLEHIESSSNKGLFPHDLSQEQQQSFFDDFVSGMHEAFLSNANLMQQLPTATREEVKQHLEEKFQKYRHILETRAPLFVTCNELEPFFVEIGNLKRVL